MCEPPHAYSEYVKKLTPGVSVSTADANGVVGRLHSTQGLCHPSTAISDAQGKRSRENLFFVGC